jgi:hypothetical protein
MLLVSPLDREPWPKHYGWENKLFGGGKVVFITTKRKLKFTVLRMYKSFAKMKFFVEYNIN